MDTTLSTKNCYFDHHIDRTFKPTNKDLVLLESKGRRLYWNLKFNYPGKYNLRIQLYLPPHVSKIYKKTIETGIWSNNEVKELVRNNRRDIVVNDITQRYIWFDMGTYDIQKVGIKQFYLEKCKSGKSFGVAKICFEYCESPDEDFEDETKPINNSDLNSNKYMQLNKEIGQKIHSFHDNLMNELNTYYKQNNMIPLDNTCTDETIPINKIEIVNDDIIKETDDIISMSELVDLTDDFSLSNYEFGVNNMYDEDKYYNLETISSPDKVHIKSLLPPGISYMIDEIVPTTDMEIKSMYHAEPALIIMQLSDDTKDIAGIYRELKVIKHEHYTYYTIGFSGGHIGIVLDGKKGYINMELDASSNICSILDKHPKSCVIKNGKVSIQFPYNFKENVKYKFFIKTKDMNLVGKQHTCYYCYFEQSNKKGWNLVGIIAKIGIHTLNTISSSIENIGCINGHLYTRKLQISNTWKFDKNRMGQFISDTSFIAKDPNNSKFTLCKNNVLEIQIGGRVANIDKQSTQDITMILNEHEKIPNVPWDLVEFSS